MVFHIHFIQANQTQLGLLSIGGGYAIIPLIQEQVVEKNGWISEKVFTDIITISQMSPEPLAVNTSTFVGLQVGGVMGALAATIGCILCGVIISLTLYLFFKLTWNLLTLYSRKTISNTDASSIEIKETQPLIYVEIHFKKFLKIKLTFFSHSAIIKLPYQFANCYQIRKEEVENSTKYLWLKK